MAYLGPEPRTATSTFTQLPSSVGCAEGSELFILLDAVLLEAWGKVHGMPPNRTLIRMLAAKDEFTTASGRAREFLIRTMPACVMFNSNQPQLVES